MPLNCQQPMQELGVKIDGLPVLAELHRFLTDRAAERRPVAYSEAMEHIGWSSQNTYERNVFAYLLKAISYLEIGVGHPPLTALVVSKTTGRPNAAFFNFARDEQRFRKDEVDEDYWLREIERVYQHWETVVA